MSNVTTQGEQQSGTSRREREARATAFASDPLPTHALDHLSRSRDPGEASRGEHETARLQAQGGSSLSEADTGDPRWQLVERILATPDFVRSPRLAEFLHYVCRAALEGRSSTLNEQHIGEAVFGRSRDYDSSADTIVRSHALRLRRRLEQYALRAGKDDRLRLEIPRGGYVPLFVPSTNATSQPATNLQAEQIGALGSSPVSPSRTGVRGDAATAVPSRDPRLLAPADFASAQVAPSSAARYRLAFLIMAVIAVTLAAALAMTLYNRSSAAAARPDAHHDLWSRLFTTDQPTRIVLGDSGLVLFHAVTWQYVSLHDYLNDDYKRQMASVQHVEPQFAEFLRGRRYTSMVDAATLGHVLRLPEATPDRTLVQYARDMRLNDFKSGNLVMIGAEEADPWVELFERSMDFVFSTDTPRSPCGISQSPPRPR